MAMVAALLLCVVATVQEVSAEGVSTGIPQPGSDETAPSPSAANEGDSARLYITNAERREAGRKYQLTPWLTAAPLVELEWQSQTLRPSEGGGTDRSREATASIQVGLVADLWESATAEAVLEYDSAIDDVVADEAFLSLEAADWEMEGGRLYTPLGIYISHFASGPLLEFAESRAEGAALAFTPTEALELTLMAYRGRARPAGGGSQGLDWAASVETRLEGGWTFGLSYQSDLADSQDALLADSNNRYRRRVDVAGGYVVWTAPEFDLSFEVMGALRPFEELEVDRNQPVAWNLEFAHFFHRRFDWALRWEGSQELEDAPAHQVGLGLTWRPTQSASLTVEYLHGWFSGSLATNSRDEPYARTNRIGAMLSIAF